MIENGRAKKSISIKTQYNVTAGVIWLWNQRDAGRPTCVSRVLLSFRELLIIC